MKKTILVLFILCFAHKGDCRVSHKDVSLAKNKFLCAKGWYRHEHGIDNYRTIYMISDHCQYCIYNALYTQDNITIDSLTWRGLKAIRHDQRFYIRKGK